MEELKKWIIKDLKFTTNEDEASEIAKVLLKGRLKSSWDFLTKRVRLKNDVELIRGNLKLREEKKKTVHIDNEEDDDYEANIIKKSVIKTRKQIDQLDHDIKRLQVICFELNSNKDELQEKLRKSASQTCQVIEHQEKLQNILHKNQQKTNEISLWTQSLSTKQDKNVANLCMEMKPILENVLKNDTKFRFDEDKFVGVHPKEVVQAILEQTRSVVIKAASESDKGVRNPDQGDVKKVLEELYVMHLEAYKNFLNAKKQTEIFDIEKERLINDNVQDENLKRLIQLRLTKRSGQSIINFLKTSLKKEAFLKNPDIPSKYALVEQQSKKILGTKLMVEELLNQTLNHKERVIFYLEEVRNQRANLCFDFQFGYDFKSLGLYDPKMKKSLSIDRFSDPRIFNVPLKLEIMFKPCLSYFFEILQEQMISRDLKRNFSKEMQYFDQFGNVQNILEVLEKKQNSFKTEINALIQQKLKKEEKQINPVDKLLHAIKIWSQEPAKEAYIQSMKDKKFKDKTLAQWYDHMRE